MQQLLPLIEQAVPLASILALQALGELLVERSGRINLGLEGMLYISYSSAALAGVATGSLAASLLAAVLAAATLALTYLLLVEAMSVDQAVVGLSLVFIGIGVGDALGSRSEGLLGPGLSFAQAHTLEALALLGLPLLLYLLLYRSWIGYAIRSTGEDERAARALGVPVRLVRVSTLAAQALLVGLAGFYFYAYYSNAAWRAGRPLGLGWLALGMVILGYWHPLGVAVASLLLGLLYSIRPLLPRLGIPNTLADATPYMVVVAALALISWLYRRTGHRPPAAVWRD